MFIIKNIEIIVKGAYLHREMTDSFFAELKKQIIPQMMKRFNLSNHGKKLRLMMFDTFDFYDMNEAGQTYYPLLYDYNGTEGFVWISWSSLNEDGAYITLGEEILPDDVVFTVCRRVPKRIDSYVRKLDVHFALADTVKVREGVANSVSQPFMYRLAEQLSQQIALVAGTGKKPQNSYQIVITGNSPLGKTVFNDSTASYTRINLVMNDGAFVKLWVKWVSLVPEKKFIETLDPDVFPTTVKFDLPFSVPDEILKEAKVEKEDCVDLYSFAKRRQEFKKRKKRGKYFFDYAVNAGAFPHCELRIEFNCKPASGTDLDIDNFYWSFMQNWNASKRHRISKQAIYEFSEVEVLDATTLILRTNFGSCKKNKVIKSFLRAIDESAFDIKKITVN